MWGSSCSIIFLYYICWPLIADNILKGLQQLMNRDKISSINDVRGIVDNPEAAMKIANDGIIDNFQT